MTRRAFRPETMPRHPWYWLRWCIDECRDFIQRGWRGYTDTDVWNYGPWMCEVSEPMLRTWAEKGVGYHGESETDWQDQLRCWADGMAAGALFWDGVPENNEQAAAWRDEYMATLYDMAEHAPDLWD